VHEGLVGRQAAACTAPSTHPYKAHPAKEYQHHHNHNHDTTTTTQPPQQQNPRPPKHPNAPNTTTTTTTTPQSRLNRLITEEVRAFFRPELLNRFDEQVVFGKLGRREVRRIAGLMLQETKDRVAEKGCAGVGRGRALGLGCF